MKMFWVMLCLVPSMAFAEYQLTLKDNSVVCGNYEPRGDHYCKKDKSGEVCRTRTEIVSITIVAECMNSSGFAQASNGSKEKTKNEQAASAPSTLAEDRMSDQNRCLSQCKKREQELAGAPIGTTARTGDGNMWSLSGCEADCRKQK